MDLLSDLSKKNVSIESIVKKVKKDEKLINDLLENTSSKKASIKYKSLKVVTELSEQQPEMLYSKWDFFVKLLDNKNTFLRAIGGRVIANLTTVDTDEKFEKIFKKYYNLLNDESMISAANVASHSGVIAKAKPHLQNKITDELIGIDKTQHSPECKNIIKGKAILTFEEYIDKYDDKQKIITFVKKELNNTRFATKKKAEKFLKKWDK